MKSTIAAVAALLALAHCCNGAAIGIDLGTTYSVGGGVSVWVKSERASERVN